MAKEKSIFQEIADSQRFQIMVDELSDSIATPWYRQYFPLSAPQMSLNYMTVLVGNANVTAASVVSRDGETPLRSREAVSMLQGEIPAIKVMRKLSERQYREYLSLQAMQVPDATKKQQALSLIWGDTKYVIESIDKRLDFLVAEGLSTGEITLTTTNNPDGLVTDAPLSLKLPGTNKKQVKAVWSSASTANPFEDIQAVVNAAAENGHVISKILMDGSLIQQMLATDAVKETLEKFSINSPTAISTVNQYLTASDLPIIEKVNFRIPIEKDGVSSTVNPWDTANAVFVPAGNLGEIKNAIAIEDQAPVGSVVYSKSGNKLISKWRENEPFGEWTKGEFNAFPSFDAIRSTYILETDEAE